MAPLKEQKAQLHIYKELFFRNELSQSGLTNWEKYFKRTSGAKPLYELHKILDEFNYFSSSSKLNILIGPNNSGKSRFLRSLFIGERLTRSIDLKTYNLFMQISKDAGDMFTVQPKLGFENVALNESLFELLLLLENRDVNSILQSYKLVSIQKCFGRLKGENNVRMNNFKGETWNNLIKKLKPLSDELVKSNTHNNRVRVYIPILRGVRKIEKSFDQFLNLFNNKLQMENSLYKTLMTHFEIDHYAVTTEKDYFSVLKPNDKLRKVFSGKELNDDLMNHLLGEEKKRKLVREFEDFLQRNYFDGSKVSFIPKPEYEDLHIKIGDNQDRSIANLGDGMQAIIIMTWPMFLYKNMGLDLYIEEPEISLHPGYLRRFLESCCDDYFGEMNVYVTTHSNHCIDFSNNPADLSIFKFEKLSNGNERFKITRSNNRDYSLLEALGAKYSSMMLSNSIIWVEGISDRVIIKKYLELYEKHINSTLRLKEDYHYAFLEYAGSNITHWSFFQNDDDVYGIQRINNKSISDNFILIADGDGVEKVNGEYRCVSKTPKSAEKTKLERYKSIESTISEKFLLLPAREIENTLSLSTIKEVLKNHHGIKDDDFENTILDHKQQRIGEFIAKILLKESCSPSPQIVNNNLSINKKALFAKRLISNINSFNDLPEDTMNFTKDLYYKILDYNGIEVNS